MNMVHDHIKELIKTYGGNCTLQNLSDVCARHESQMYLGEAVQGFLETHKGLAQPEEALYLEVRRGIAAYKQQ